jgi:hypothetical protein
MLKGRPTARIRGGDGRDCAIQEIHGRVPGFGRNGKNPEHQKLLLEMATAWETVARQKKSELAATTDQ